MSSSWQFWIDVGGTFTDCIGISPAGELLQCKVLSSGVTRGQIRQRLDQAIVDPLRAQDPADFWLGATCRLLNTAGQLLDSIPVTGFDPVTARLSLAAPCSPDAVAYELDASLPAPVLAIRWLLQLPPQAPCPAVQVRFGTTRGTNALLTRTGANTVLLTTRGFADVPLIGNQDRPELFCLNIRKPDPLFSSVVEVDERMTCDGVVLKPMDLSAERERLQQAGVSPQRFDSVAVCLLNAWINPEHEKQLESLLREMGFAEISRSSDVSPLIRIVPRCDTTVLDAYLNPVLRSYLQQIQEHLNDSQIHVMTSTGGLVDSRAFRGRDCILSGPAGGIVGFSTAARLAGFRRSIGFDMGGTSTDVARFDGEYEFENETVKAGVRILSPVLAIETVAAGGGSICGFDGTRLYVGPQSAGADPGPACYGAGGPLTVTDLNVFLGRVLPQHFPFPLDTAAITQRLQQLRQQLLQAQALAQETSLHQLAEGLLQLANDNMVQAIRRVSVAKGYHPADYVLVSFGGAGGQHACSIARSLQMSQVLVPAFAGILSAWGMGQADVRVIRQASVLQPLNSQTLDDIRQRCQTLQAEMHEEIRGHGIPDGQIQSARLSLELRYSGTDSGLTISEHPTETFEQRFERQHQMQFGYVRPSKTIEVASLQLEMVGRSGRAADTAKVTQSERTATAVPENCEVWFQGRLHRATVIHRDSIHGHASVKGPAIIVEPASTIFVEPQCSAAMTESGALLIQVDDHLLSPLPGLDTDVAAAAGQVDPVLLEVFNNQFVSIAEQMGEMLRRTSTSTNVRERLDFSCALFDQAGQLVVNAPHVPVHLGAMGDTVRSLMQQFPQMQPGDVYVTNDPYHGGSHLPDVTVVTPVFCQWTHTAAIEQPAFFVASRAHHAEIGGIVPGSMPPFSRTLAEEGVLITSRKLVDAGQSCEEEMRQMLGSGSWPSRAVRDNLADMAAQAAANACGVRLLQELAQRCSTESVHAYMRAIQNTSAKKMRQCLQKLPDASHYFQDVLDDGTVIAVTVTIHNETAVVDFSGTAGIHSGNLNANTAITTSAVLYCFRCLLNEDIPLNAGVLEPVTIIIPPGLLNPTAGSTPETSPAVVGGNVETSQRIVDVVLGALGLAAASQGTMNNLTFGDAEFGYYETICGGAGATSAADGADAVHTHMTNTRLTDPEVMEQRFPVRVRQFSIRRGSGGQGARSGGDGVIRELEFLRPLQVSMLSQRRQPYRPYGLLGGGPGQSGRNVLLDANGSNDLQGCFSLQLNANNILRIETPGGGGVGAD